MFFITKIKQFFCRHEYEIGVLVGLGFRKDSKVTAVDGAEITCFCSKCGKVFVTKTVRSDGRS